MRSELRARDQAYDVRRKRASNKLLQLVGRGRSHMTIWRRILSVSLISSHLAMLSPLAHGGMVATEASLTPTLSAETLLRALDRDAVRAQLVSHGVSVEAAKARVEALTDAEIASLAKRFGVEPAGGFFEAVIIGFLVWAVLHATDYGGIFMNDEEKKAQ